VSEPARAASASLARPYSWTDGRTLPAIDLALEALVETTARGRAARYNHADPLSVVTELCHQPHSVIEVAARLSVPIGVARVLVGDLLGAGLVTIRDTIGEHATWDQRHDLLERVLSGLRTL
jgi:hypothetical protein